LNLSPWIFGTAAVLGALGMWLMLPRPAERARLIGVVLGAVSLGLMASEMPGLGDRLADRLADVTFYTLAGVTVVAAVATITFSNPIYCAIWFGLSLLGTAGLFLLQGAQFLAVATIVVYAGAILVTFLFVLMLAQPRGRAAYDRTAWESHTAAWAGVVLVAVLSATVSGVLTGPHKMQPTVAITQADRERVVLRDDHVAAVGSELFGRHLLTVEVAGTLLLAALVGAAAIVGRSKGPLASPGSGQPPPEQQEANTGS
jgi:NADH-quinone oxidoreductase subunit J